MAVRRVSTVTVNNSMGYDLETGNFFFKKSVPSLTLLWEGTGGGQNLPPPVPFCSASPASFIGNILYYNRACVFLIAFNYTKKGQVKES